MPNKKFKTVDEYIGDQPEHVQEILQKIRQIVKEIVPGVEEKISYNLPTFCLNNTYVVYMSGYQHHISLYPYTENMLESIDGLSAYIAGKGTIQFPLNKPIPYDIVRKIVDVRIKENKKKV